MNKFTKVVYVDNEDIVLDDDGQGKSFSFEMPNGLYLDVISYDECDVDAEPDHSVIDELIEKGFTVTIEVNS